MRACWLKWVGRDWSISADYIWLNYSGANSVSVMPKSQYEDLRLEVDYVSGTGLTLNEAKSLSDEHHIDFYMQEVINGSDTIDLPQRLHISEVT